MRRKPRRTMVLLGLIGFVVFGVFAFRRAGVDLGGLLRPAAPSAGSAASAASSRSPAAGESCAVEAAGIALPAALRETSGIARTADGSLWTHNDGAEARLYRLNQDGSIAQTVALEGTRAVDIEDIDAASCPGGAGECLWLADTGDNDGERDEVALLIVPVPPVGADRAPHTRVAFAWPEGPRDAEALAVLPDAQAALVTKGRDAPIEVYRLAATDGRGAAAAPHRIAQLAPQPDDRRSRVGGAAASEDGAWIALRTEVELAIFRAQDLLRGNTTPVLTHDLRPLRESQGEGIELAADGRVWLTSEGERGTPTLARLRCTLPE